MQDRHAPKRFSWRGSWRSTYLNLPQAALPLVDCSGVFSDALHRPFFCSQVNLLRYTQSIPSSNRIPRLPNLTSSEFSESWSDRPFILTEPVRKWPVQQKWCQDTLLKQYGDVVFRAEAVDWPLKTYIQYMNHNTDESPLYLFDRSFVEKMNLSVGQDGGAYWAPECFGEDYFSLLGSQRPDHRWLIIGPERSGSTFHKDPNATSAWNAVVRGSKYWIMFPSSANTSPPPGVFVSDDHSEVTSPLSIAEWLLTFHEEARHTPGCLEGVCAGGEILHVPSGWWHLVVNLESAIAITQNFVPKSHVTAAIDFLKNKPEQVSGFKSGIQNPHELFVDQLREHHPGLIKKQEGFSKKRKWEDVTHTATEENGPVAFSFGFGEDVEEE